MGNKEITGGTIIGILILIYFVNQICTELFYFFRFLTGVALVFAIVLSFMKVDEVMWVWVAVGVCLLLTGVTYACGPGFAKTEIGDALVDAGNTSYNAFNELREAEVKAINDIIDTTCKQVSEDDCQLLKDTAKTVRTVQELTDFSKKLQKTAKAVEKVSE
ncbi:MAG: hypothetical protein U9O94_03210 [Nanoarchaeota archaeon]|nr:hypothetical protein [Nanoarchaeota archaeon]